MQPPNGRLPPMRKIFEVHKTYVKSHRNLLPNIFHATKITQVTAKVLYVQNRGYSQNFNAAFMSYNKGYDLSSILKVNLQRQSWAKW